MLEKLTLVALTASAFAVACGGSDPAPKTAADAPSPSAPSAATATSPTTATAPPPAAASPAAPAAPAAGLERRFARLANGKDKPSIAVSIDVPAEWGQESDRLSMSVAPCRVEGPFSKLSLSTLSCDGLEACQARRDPTALAAAKRESPSPSRAWIIEDRDVHGHRQIDAELLVVKAGAATVSCHVMGLAGGDLALFDRYKAACDTLTLDPREMPGDATSARPARPSPEDLAGPSTPREKALNDTALAFVTAAAKRDLKAARAVVFGLGSGGCPAGTRDVARCQKDLARMATALPKVLESVPADFEPAWVELRPDTPAKGITSAMVHGKANACGEGVGLMMMDAPDGKAWVSFAFRE